MTDDLQTREASPTGAGPRGGKRVPLTKLPGRQRAVLDVVVRYYRATQEPCPAAYLARRLEIHHSSVQRHMFLLHRKGWLRAPNSPAVPTRW
jgi:hypothetical protein